MTLREFLDHARDLPPETQVCVAEVDEAFAMNLASVEVVRNAKLQSETADGSEAVELANGEETVLVARW